VRLHFWCSRITLVGYRSNSGFHALGPLRLLGTLCQSTMLPRTPSNPSLQDLNPQPYGPLSGPSDTTWRRRRLLGIGANQSIDTGSNADERTPFARYDSLPQNSSYGSLPPPIGLSPTRSTFRSLRRLPSIGVRVPGITTGPSSPQISPTTSTFRKSYFSGQRPISAYDASLVKPQGAGPDAGPHLRTNGIRVWYSSYSSVDWLHDAIKGSVRTFRLRKHRSFRGRWRSRIDRSIGWIIVTIVGFLSAVVAFMIVRSEQWLFDLKNGYCTTGWWKAERFCCPDFEDGLLTTPHFVERSQSEVCENWRMWADVFAGKGNPKLGDDVLGYLMYAGIAVSANQSCGSLFSFLRNPQLTWAVISCLLTIYLTASNSFVTRKDSCVVGPSIGDADEIKDPNSVHPPYKRGITYYVGQRSIDHPMSLLTLV
jgi:chloride channel 3/4/5